MTLQPSDTSDQSLLENPQLNLVPVLKLSIIGTDYMWLLTNSYSIDQGTAFGITQMNGKVTVGDIDLKEMLSQRGPDCREQYLGTLYSENELMAPRPVVELAFEGKYPLSVYLDVAAELGSLHTDDTFNREVWQKHKIG